MIMTKWTASQCNDNYEDESGTKQPLDFLTILHEMGAETYSEVLNFDLD